MSTEITCEQLMGRIQPRASCILAEVLPAASYDAGHLPGAVHLPLEAIAGPRVAEIVRDKNVDIVVYCAGPTCQDAHIAARKLESLGYAKVWVFTGGKAAWREAGQPLVKTAPRRPAAVAAHGWLRIATFLSTVQSAVSVFSRP